MLSEKRILERRVAELRLVSTCHVTSSRIGRLAPIWENLVDAFAQI